MKLTCISEQLVEIFTSFLDFVKISMVVGHTGLTIGSCGCILKFFSNKLLHGDIPESWPLFLKFLSSLLKTVSYFHRIGLQ